MKVLIAGAAGTLGRRVASILIAGGHRVWGTTRGRADALTALGIRPVVADLLDAGATQRAVEQAQPDAIVQVLNALPAAGPSKPQDMQATNRIRVQGTQNLVAAARRAGVGRYVVESFALIYGTRPIGSPAVTEDAPPASGLPPSMQEPVDALASLERDVLDAGGIVLRCGMFYGLQVPSTQALAAGLRARKIPVFGFRGVMPWLHVNDAAAAFAAALTSEEPRQIYNISGPPEPIAAMIRAVANATGAPAPRRLPRPMVRFAGAYLAAMLRSNLALSTDKARARLGWTPLHQTVAAALAAEAGIGPR